MLSKKISREIFNILDEKYGIIKPFLNHNSPFQLLIAVILSAQTTDLMVNKVTKDLFERFPDAISLKNADEAEVQKLISRINYYKTKSKNIIKTAKMIDEDFCGEIPNSIEKLILLPGVGRKVANVIMADSHNIVAGVVVDTHIKRVTKRIGWTNSTEPKKIEQDLIKNWTKDRFINTPKQLILIGRNYCFPKNPDCQNCPISRFCKKKI